MRVQRYIFSFNRQRVKAKYFQEKSSRTLNKKEINPLFIFFHR